MAQAAPTQITPIIPALAEWEMLKQQAQLIADSGLFPRRVKKGGNWVTEPRPVAEIITIGLAARDYGLSLVDGMKNIIPIYGQVTMSAELMRALARRNGYDYKFAEVGPTRATFVLWRRANPAETWATTYTIEQARQDGLIEKENSKYNRDPEAMMIARASARGIRTYAPEVLRRAYTPEELGAEIEIADDGQELVVLPPEQPAPMLPTIEGEFSEEYVLPDEWRVKLVDWMVRLDYPEEVQREHLEAITGEADAKAFGKQLRAELDEQAPAGTAQRLIPDE